MEFPPLIHFYSAATGVSLELPVGFERAGEDERTAHYQMTDEDDTEVVAGVVVQVIAAVEPGAEEASIQAVVESFAAVTGAQIEERIAVVDDVPTRTVVLHPPVATTSVPALGGIATADSLVHFTAVAFGHGIRTISAFAPWADRDQWIAVFDKAVASCRFI